MPIQKEITALSLVFRGNFNPSIFHPIWFHNQGLITEQEKEKAQEKVTTLSDLATFETDWFVFQITIDRMLLYTTKEPYFDKLLGLTISILEILPQTPITTFGINNESHFKIQDEKSYQDIGDRLAPKEKLWDQILTDPKLKNIVIEEKPRRDGREGYVQVKVEPSSRVKPQGIYIQMNDHFDVNNDKMVESGNMKAKSIMNESWKDNQERWEEVYSNICKWI